MPAEQARTAERPLDARGERGTRPEKETSGGRRGGQWGKKIALLLVSASLAFLALEGAFRLAGYRPLYDVYSKPEAFWTADPLLGWSLKPGSSGTYVGPRPFPISFRTHIRINSLGLRGPEVAPVPPGGKRVLMLGDSQTAGFEVPEDKTFVSLTGKNLASLAPFPVQVINGGIRGYGTDQSFLLYTRRLRKLRPNVVVFNPTSNDPDDNVTLHRPRRPFGKAAFALMSDGSIKLVGRPIPRYPTCSSVKLDKEYRRVRVDTLASRAACGFETRLSDRSAVFSFVVSRLRQNPSLVRKLWRAGNAGEQTVAPPPAPAGNRNSPPARDSGPPLRSGEEPQPTTPLGYEDRLTSALIERLAAEVKADGARFILLIDDSDLRHLDEAALRRDGIELVKPNEVLGADQRTFRIPNDGHLNERGHRLVADLLAPRLAAVLSR